MFGAKQVGAAVQHERPDVVIVSPYVRAVGTAEIVAMSAGMDCQICLDERLREREFGVLDLLTRRGSGPGDVRAGLGAGTAERSGDAAQAACWGTLVHALAGQRLGERHGQLGFLAREIIGEIAFVISSPA